MWTVRLTDHGQHWPGQGVLLAGRYRLEEYLASGSVAVLWRAVDEQLDRPVAVKLLLPHHGGDDTVAARFRREALAIAAVRSPHVVRIFDIAQHAGTPLLVMEYVDGPALSAFRGRRLDAAQVAATGHQVASALAAVHTQGLVHRDIKPANIVFETATGRAKLLDFGIIKDLRDQTVLTDEHDLVATVRYAAPEQVAGEPVGPASDVYSLGLVLWEACTGRPVFQGVTPAETALARLRQDPPPVTDWRPDLPSRLAEIIARATRRHRDTRYHDGQQLADALGGLCGPLPHALTRGLAATDPTDTSAERTITTQQATRQHA